MNFSSPPQPFGVTPSPPASRTGNTRAKHCVYKPSETTWRNHTQLAVKIFITELSSNVLLILTKEKHMVQVITDLVPRTRSWSWRRRRRVVCSVLSCKRLPVQPYCCLVTAPSHPVSSPAILLGPLQQNNVIRSPVRVTFAWYKVQIRQTAAHPPHKNWW